MNQFFISLFKWLETTRSFSMQAMFMVAKNLNITKTQMGALLYIHKMGVGNVSSIGSVLGITNSATCQMLDKLVDIGLLNRSVDQDDRRKKILEVSEKGNDAIKKAFSTQEDWLHRLANSFSPNEQKQIDSALKLLLDKIDELNFNLID